MTLRRTVSLLLSVVAVTCFPLSAQQLSTTERGRLEAAVHQVIAETQVPSASVGVARGGVVVYTQAFGDAVLPRNVPPPPSANDDRPTPAAAMTKATPANAAMAYPIGSISKQFTAACLLLLQERGKLRLDDPVAKWFPNFTQASQVTVRNLLTHTSGYSDYAPQDYTIPAWTHAVQPIDLVTMWATKPLDFAPGTKWEYSNTNFQLAALIVERASGQRFHDFLWQNVIAPLKLQGVLDLDVDRDRLQVRGYEQHALSPSRPAVLESVGWYSGDAQLAMPVATLLAWDESIVHRSLLKPESYVEMETAYRLKDGTDSGYGLGVFVQKGPSGRVVLHHSGEVGGFVSNNVVSLSDDVSYAVLTNEEARVAGMITKSMTPILLPWYKPTKPASPAVAGNPDGMMKQTPAVLRAEAQAQTILTSLQESDLDPTLFTADANSYFSPQTLDDYATSLAPLGEIRSVRQTGEQMRGGMTFRQFEVTFAQRKLLLTTYTTGTGRLEQFLIGPGE